MTTHCPSCNNQTAISIAEIYDDRHGNPDTCCINVCHKCGHGMTLPKLSEDELGHLYAKYYPRRYFSSENSRAAANRVLRRSNFSGWWEGSGTECHQYVSTIGSVLDVGCGDCHSLLVLKARGHNNIQGTEVDPTLQIVASELGLPLHCGPVQTLPGQTRYDWILARQVLEHAPDPLKLLRAMHDRLAITGKIVLSVPNAGSLMRRVLGRRWLHWHAPYHQQHFTKTSIGAIAQRAGLRVDWIKTITPNTWLLLQWHTLRRPTHHGIRDPIWDGLDNTQKTRFELLILPKLARLIARSLDISGTGESIVCQLSLINPDE
jgi:SAM-dependent methyltransferase